MLRAFLNAIGLGRPATPANPPKSTEAVASSSHEYLASLVPGQDISAVLATLPDAPKRGRPSTYPDGPATSAERMRRHRWVKSKTRRDMRDENQFRHGDEIPPLKEEEKKSGAPILKDWRPDPDGERLGKKVFGDRYEAELADHIDYCLKTDFRCHDHDANWRRRCRAVQRNPQLGLGLRPQTRQLGVMDCQIIEPSGKRGNWRRPKKRTVHDVARELAEECRREAPMRDVTPTASSEEDKARVRESLERFRRGGSKEAAG